MLELQTKKNAYLILLTLFATLGMVVFRSSERAAIAEALQTRMLDG